MQRRRQRPTGVACRRNWNDACVLLQTDVRTHSLAASAAFRGAISALRLLLVPLGALHLEVANPVERSRFVDKTSDMCERVTEKATISSLFVCILVRCTHDFCCLRYIFGKCTKHLSECSPASFYISNMFNTRSKCCVHRHRSVRCRPPLPLFR